MKDADIVALYWQRNEAALQQTQQQYGRYIRGIAHNILGDAADSEECLNDTLLKAWQAIPPQRPAALAPFLGRLARGAAIDRWRARSRQKRQGSQYALSLAEWEDCLPAPEKPEQTLEAGQLAAAVSAFLHDQKPAVRTAFVERYFYCDPLREIAARQGCSETAVKSMLFRARRALKRYLAKEGYLV